MCTASNGAAPDQNHTVELKGIPKQMHVVLSEYVYYPTRFQCKVIGR